MADECHGALDLPTESLDFTHGFSWTLHSSFVPAKCFREMRTVSRLLSKTTDEQSRARSRYLKTLNFIGCRASSVFSDVRGKAATAILEVLAEGTREQLIDAIKL